MCCLPVPDKAYDDCKLARFELFEKGRPDVLDEYFLYEYLTLDLEIAPEVARPVVQAFVAELDEVRRPHL